MLIRNLTSGDYAAVVQLANAIHGDNYLDVDSLKQMHKQGIKANTDACFVALDDNEQIVGYRISFAAGQWIQDEWCSVELWPFAADDMAYFKSVGVLSEMRGKGIASALLQHSIEALKQQGAKAGLAHIWRESPGNAAERYFSYAGAKLIKVHPDRWRHLSETIGYCCPRCGELCRCSAAEMILVF